MSKATFYYENATQVLEYDDCGDIVSQIEYNTDGSVHYSHTYDIVRDDNGHVIRQKKYINGKLCTEREYSYSEDGYGTYTSKRTEYTSDRIEYTLEYDENGNIISEIHYDEEGNIIE